MESEEEDDITVSIRTSFLGEKAAACSAIGEIAIHVGAAFIPYVDKSVEAINPLLLYFHENVRRAAIVSIQRMYDDDEVYYIVT